jgi:hypothetical protein
LACDLNAKHPFWSTAILNPSGGKYLDLFDINKFEISAHSASLITLLRENVPSEYQIARCDRF